MIRVVICDGNGTLELPNPSSAIRDLVKTISSLGIELAITSNNYRSSIIKSVTKAGLSIPKIIVTPEDFHKLKAKPEIVKPNPNFVYKVRDLTRVQLNEIIYIGDNDRTDIYCAINAGVLPIAARYSNSEMKYGLPFDSPKDLKNYLLTFAMQEAPYFGWRYSGSCLDTDTDIDVRALIGDHGGLTNILEDVLKHQRDVRIGSSIIRVRDLLFYYFVSQCYLSGLINDIDLVTFYPGHQTNSLNPTLEQYSRKISKIFRDRFEPNLILRHQNALESKKQGAGRNIFEQFRTVQINPACKEKIVNKRILVLDDFTTHGYSLETARRMLSKAGAGHVVCLAIAKFRQRHSVTTISKSWNPFMPCTLQRKDINCSEEPGEPNQAADEYFRCRIWNFYSSQ